VHYKLTIKEFFCLHVSRDRPLWMVSIKSQLITFGINSRSVLTSASSFSKSRFLTRTKQSVDPTSFKHTGSFCLLLEEDKGYSVRLTLDRFICTGQNLPWSVEHYRTCFSGGTMTSCGNHAGGCVSLDTTNSYPSLKHRYGLKCFCGDKVYLKSLELVKAV